jgi:hypothetical protein
MPRSYWTTLICAWIAAVAVALLVSASSPAASEPIASPGSVSAAGLVLLLPLLALTAAVGMRIAGSSGFPGGWGGVAVAVSSPFVFLGAREPAAASAVASVLICILLIAGRGAGARGVVLAGFLLAASSLRSHQLLYLLPFFFAVLVLSRRPKQALLFAALTILAAAAAVKLGLVDVNARSWAGGGYRFASWREWSKILHSSPALLALAGYSPLLVMAVSGAPPGEPAASKTPAILLAGTIALSLALLPAAAHSDSAPVLYLLAYASIAALACRGARVLETILGARGNLYWKVVVAALLLAPGLVTFSLY